MILFRTSTSFRAQLGESTYKKWLLVDDYLSAILGEKIDDPDSPKYRLTAAFGGLLFGAPDLDAINYPSVATHDRGINICFLPEKADALLEPSEAWVIRIEAQASHPDSSEPLHQISFVKRSKEIGPDWLIEWLPPGVGVASEEIFRFARHRVTSLTTRPQPL